MSTGYKFLKASIGSHEFLPHNGRFDSEEVG
jgi:hypothetical protein